MLKDAKNAELLSDYLHHIRPLEVRDAFVYLVGAAAADMRFQCYGALKGVVRDFRFYDASGEQHYAFIVNRESLLFYFRAPAVTSGRHDFEQLSKLFTEVHKNNAGEWTVRVLDLASAQRLWQWAL